MALTGTVRKLGIRGRIMHGPDLPRVLAILQHDQPAFTEDDLLKMDNRQDVLSLVALIHEPRWRPGDEIIAGIAMLGIDQGTATIVQMAVDIGFRRRGVGRFLVETLGRKCLQANRGTLTAIVRESNLAACKFLRSTGFEASALLRDWFEDTAEDGYQFEKKLGRS